MRRGLRFEVRGSERGLGVFALGLERVHTQVERRGLVEAVDQRPELVAQLGLQPLRQPLRQVVPQALGQRRAVDRTHLHEPLLLLFVERGAQKPRVALPCQHSKTPLHLALARLRQMLIQQAMAQYLVSGLGQRVPLARTERSMLLEEGRHYAIGG